MKTSFAVAFALQPLRRPKRLREAGGTLPKVLCKSLRRGEATRVSTLGVTLMGTDIAQDLRNLFLDKVVQFGEGSLRGHCTPWVHRTSKNARVVMRLQIAKIPKSYFNSRH